MASFNVVHKQHNRLTPRVDAIDSVYMFLCCCWWWWCYFFYFIVYYYILEGGPGSLNCPIVFSPVRSNEPMFDAQSSFMVGPMKCWDSRR